MLKPWRLTIATFCFMLALGLGYVGVRADSLNRETKVTFYEPVQVGDEMLAAGTYVIRRMVNPGSQEVVQVFDADGIHLITTVIGIPAFRREPADKATITLAERDLNGARPLKSWFYPGEQYGVEFETPATVGTQFARISNEQTGPVYVEPTSSAPETFASSEENGASPVNESYAPAPTSTVGDNLDEAESVIPSSSDYSPVTETESETETDVDSYSAESASAPSTTSNQEELPRTASSLPLAGLVGLASLGLGFLMRARRQKIG